ncbi:MAG TPA: hydroxymethylbilane synthase [Syntrophobacteria bacterium]|nr:hydroxymethylbilane synthase [Syntrophobacteria bacterium]
MQVRIGTRGSALALWQAEWVRSQLRAAHPGLTVDLVTIKTQGDKILDVPLAKVGGKGLFVKEIEEALLEGRVDVAVHSMKDMPADLLAGLHVAAVPLREDPRDVLVMGEGSGFADLPRGARVGTSSLRRAAQLLHLRADLKIETLRGNLDTRLRKLEAQGFHAVVLAAAGIKRMGLSHLITQYLEPELMLPAVGQGALGIETRTEDAPTNELVAGLAHQPTMVAVRAERAFLRRLQGGCQVPIGGYATLEGERLVLTGMVADLQGRRVIRRVLHGEARQAEEVGENLAEVVLAAGGADILAEIYGSPVPAV